MTASQASYFSFPFCFHISLIPTPSPPLQPRLMQAPSMSTTSAPRALLPMKPSHVCPRAEQSSTAPNHLLQTLQQAEPTPIFLLGIHLAL